jgi:hypothetical protein
MDQLICVAIIFLATTASAQQDQRESRVDAALADLASQDPGTQDSGLSALLAEGRIDLNGVSSMRVTVNNLLRTHPRQAERIKTTLIAALERRGADHVRLAQRKQPVSEDPESWMFLTDAVAELRDPRAVKGLVLALGVGSIAGLADICPSAVDAIIERVHQPDLYQEGIAEGYPRQAVTALGWCLQRPALMRANPGLLAKIRRELLADLDDCTIAGHAMDALSALRADPEVRTRLQIIATSKQPDMHCYLSRFASSILGLQ